METKYFNLSRSPFHFMLCPLGQIHLEFKGLKNQVMKSMEVKTPGAESNSETSREEKSGEHVVRIGE